MHNGLYDTTEPVLVPDIDDETLAAMRKQIRPAMIVDNRIYAIKDPDSLDPRGVSFLWDAEKDGDPMIPSPLDHLKIVSFHGFGAPVFFKPSLAEAYASIRRFCPDWSHIRWFALELPEEKKMQIFEPCHLALCHLWGESLRAR